MSFELVIRLKNIGIYTGGVFTGLFLGTLLLFWFIKTGVLDKELPSIKVMRIKKGLKTLYVWSPKNLGSVIHTVLIIFGWRLNLIRKNSVFYEDAKISKIVTGLFISIGILVVLCSTFLMIHIIR